jgi:adenylate kinase family enzyme
LDYLRNADRIAVVGVRAAGKTTFARALAARTGLPLLHGDQLEWLPNWQLRPPGELQAMHAEWIARPRWIIEGWVELDRAARLNAADIVVDLDFSRWVCTGRVLKRMLRHGRREEMPEGCEERFRPHTLPLVFFKRERPSVDAALAAATMKSYVRLKSPREAEAWLAAL